MKVDPSFIVALSELSRYEVYTKLVVGNAEIWCRLGKNGSPTKDTASKFWVFLRAAPRGIFDSKKPALECRDRLNAQIPTRGLDGRGCPL